MHSRARLAALAVAMCLLAGTPVEGRAGVAELFKEGFKWASRGWTAGSTINKFTQTRQPASTAPTGTGRLDLDFSQVDWEENMEEAMANNGLTRRGSPPSPPPPSPDSSGNEAIEQWGLSWRMTSADAPTCTEACEAAGLDVTGICVLTTVDGDIRGERRAPSPPARRMLLPSSR